MIEPKGLQFVRWFPEWIGFGFKRLNPLDTDLAYIYSWCLFLGFWEVRKWSELEPL